MSQIRELEERRAELTSLRSLLQTAQDDFLERPLLRSKIASREREITDLEANPVIEPETEVLLGGRGVSGSIGIDAKFAAQILDSYQDMISTHYGARIHPGMRRTGPRPGEQESKVYLTALPRGSFGLRLAQPNPHDFVSAQQISAVMDELTSLVDSAAAGDAAFSQGVERFHPRVIVPLNRFLDALASKDASLTIRSSGRQTSLAPQQVQAAHDRVASIETVQNQITVRGVFRGVLLESLRFDFVPANAAPISGTLADSVTEQEALSMVALCDQQCEALLNRLSYRTHGGISRPSYELVRLSRINSIETS